MQGFSIKCQDFSLKLTLRWKIELLNTKVDNISGLTTALVYSLKFLDFFRFGNILQLNN